MDEDESYPGTVPAATGQGRPLDLRQMSETDMRGTGCSNAGTSGSAGEGAPQGPLLPSLMEELSATDQAE